MLTTLNDTSPGPGYITMCTVSLLKTFSHDIWSHSPINWSRLISPMPLKDAHVSASYQRISFDFCSNPYIVKILENLVGVFFFNFSLPSSFHLHPDLIPRTTLGDVYYFYSILLWRKLVLEWVVGWLVQNHTTSNS